MTEPRATQPDRRTHTLEYRTQVGEIALEGVEWYGGDHEQAIIAAQNIAAMIRANGHPHVAEMWTDVANLIERRARTEAGARPR